MADEITWFTVRLALLGLSPASGPQAAKNLADELPFNTYLRNPRVIWESELHRIVIQVDTEDTKPGSAANQVREEMMEILAAVWKDTEGTHYELLGVEPSTDQ